MPPESPSQDQPLVMSHRQMNDAYLSGLATPLARSVSWLVRYQGSWWVVYECGWLRVTDDLVELDIDACATPLAQAAGEESSRSGRLDSGWQDRGANPGPGAGRKP